MAYAFNASRHRAGAWKCAPGVCAVHLAPVGGSACDSGAPPGM